MKFYIYILNDLRRRCSK